MTGPVSEQGVSSRPGYINGGMMQREAPGAAPLCSSSTSTTSTTHSQRCGASQGSSMVVPKQPVGEMGFSAYFTDPEAGLGL